MTTTTTTQERRTRRTSPAAIACEPADPAPRSRSLGEWHASRPVSDDWRSWLACATSVSVRGALARATTRWCCTTRRALRRRAHRRRARHRRRRRLLRYRHDDQKTGVIV